MKSSFNATILFVIIGLSTMSISFSQVDVNIENQITIGGAEDDYPMSICKTNEGFILTGLSYSGVSGNKTDASQGFSDVWVVKVDESLQIQWQKSFGGNMFESGKSVISTGDGNFIISGTSSSSMNGDIDSVGFGVYDYWIFKMNETGDIVWQNLIGGSGLELGGYAIQLSNGNLIIAGSSNSNISGYKTENSRGAFDYWVVCTDSLGQVLWDRTYGGSESDNLEDVILLNEDHLLLSGVSYSPISGEKTEAVYGMGDIWLVNINTANGEIEWDKTIGGSGDEAYPSLAILNNHIYISASSESMISGTKTEPSIAWYDFWITKMDYKSNIIWDKTIGSDMADHSFDVLVSHDEKIVIAGASNSNVYADKTEACFGDNDYWVVCIDTMKNIAWQKTLGGSGADRIFAINETAQGGYMIAGSSDSDQSGLKSESCNGKYDFWLLDIKPLLIFNQVPKLELKSYPNPFTNMLNMEFPESLLGDDLIIYDINGVEVFKTTILNSKIEISGAMLVPGTYIAKVRNDHSQIVVGSLVRY